MKTGRRRKGFTIIEVIIDAFVITAIFGAVVSSFIMVLKTVNNGRVREVATALANEQMETLRNDSYDSLSTQHGTILPHGSIPDTQTLTRSNTSFVVTTAIIFIDDPFDGCAIPIGNNLYQCTDGQTSTQQDLAPIDYKRITITVAQATNPGLVLASLTSNVSAKAAETPSNTGMLLVIVNDASGAPVSGATVTVTNATYNISVQGITNDQGYVFVSGLTPDTHNEYHIVATMNGYSTDMTYTRTPQNPNQFQPDVNINLQQVTTQTLSIDKLATLAVTVADQSGAPLPNILLTATSTKISQNNPVTPKNTYTATTNASGVATFANIEWDGYSLTLPSGYTVITTSPYQPVSVNPGVTTSVTIVATTQSGWPQITDISPSSAKSGTVISFDINGSNFGQDTTVVLKMTGQANITPTSVSPAANGKSVSVTVDLTNAAVGNWDVVVTTGGKTITQLGGFSVQ